MSASIDRSQGFLETSPNPKRAPALMYLSPREANQTPKYGYYAPSYGLYGSRSAPLSEIQFFTLRPRLLGLLIFEEDKDDGLWNEYICHETGLLSLTLAPLSPCMLQPTNRPHGLRNCHIRRWAKLVQSHQSKS